MKKRKEVRVHHREEGNEDIRRMKIMMEENLHESHPRQEAAAGATAGVAAEKTEEELLHHLHHLLHHLHHHRRVLHRCRPSQ